MNKEVTIKVCDVIGSPICVAVTDGQKVYKRIKTAFEQGQQVHLSFADTEPPLIPAFLYPAIGQLYETFTEGEINSHLKIVDIDPDELEYINDIQERAKDYFQDPQRFDDAWRETMGDDDDVIDLGEDEDE